MLRKILVAENSPMFAKALKLSIEAELKFDVLTAGNLSEVEYLLEKEGRDIFVGITGLDLPGATEGGVVDLMVSRGLPVIVFTGSFDEEFRKKPIFKKVVDYILKETHHSMQYIVSLIRRLDLNDSVKVLIVDDSPVVRLHISDLLKVHRYHALEAADGREALKVLEQNQDIKLIITDYNMPNMDGLLFTAEVRKKFKSEQLAIIGISTTSGDSLSARFIKNGANDFLHKPFSTEEFYCRVTHNVDMIDHFDSLRKAREEAESATELKDKFVSLVAHDLRSPFTAILGFLDIVLEDEEKPLPREHREMLEMVRRRGKDLVDMIQELLDIGRFKTGQIKPEYQFLDACFLAMLVMEKYKPQAEGKGVTLTCEVPEHTRLFTDQILASQVIENLVANAIKFTKKGDRVTIISLRGDDVTLAVKDTGVGIKEARWEKLFSYEEATSTTGTSGEKGTGLGLPLCRDIMEAHGGSLELESAPDRGTTFFARFPRREPRVFIVDDDQVVRLAVKKMLAGLDLDIIEFENGKKALDSLSGKMPHLIITDMEMPVMGGLEMITNIRRVALKGLPIIVLTGDEREETRESVFRMGADDFVNKPMDARDFIPRVRRYVS